MVMNVHIVQVLILSLALMHIHLDMELNLDEIINILPVSIHVTCQLETFLLIVMLRL